MGSNSIMRSKRGITWSKRGDLQWSKIVNALLMLFAAVVVIVFLIILGIVALQNTTIGQLFDQWQIQLGLAGKGQYVNGPDLSTKDGLLKVRYSFVNDPETTIECYELNYTRTLPGGDKEELVYSEDSGGNSLGFSTSPGIRKCLFIDDTDLLAGRTFEKSIPYPAMVENLKVRVVAKDSDGLVLAVGEADNHPPFGKDVDKYRPGLDTFDFMCQMISQGVGGWGIITSAIDLDPDLMMVGFPNSMDHVILKLPAPGFMSPSPTSSVSKPYDCQTTDGCICVCTIDSRCGAGDMRICYTYPNSFIVSADTADNLGSKIGATDDYFLGLRGGSSPLSVSGENAGSDVVLGKPINRIMVRQI